ncbi:MAG TPA: hypothetical protein VHM70_15890 [Polyangiaceae bacterium]|jgi:hypothetical protein|nr:hypothetical protein [Polyangiaceae bacterium]
MGRLLQFGSFIVVLVSVWFAGVQTARADADPTCAESDIKWDNPDPKELFRQVSEVALCGRTQQDPEIVARVTDAYAERAKSPPCHIVLWNAEAHRTLAQRLSNLRLPGPSQRGEARLHWELARDGFEAISRAGDKAANNKRILDECVNPARASLAMFPQVTIRIEPLESEGQVLQWNEEIITDTKPRVTPGQHQLAINPPVGSSMKVFVNSVPQRVLRGVVPITVEYGDKLEILVRFYDGEIGSADDPDRNPDPTALQDGKEGGGGSVVRPVLIWSGIGVGVVAGIIATSQFIKGSNRDASGQAIYDDQYVASNCKSTNSATCRGLQQDIQDYYSAADSHYTWGGIWTGISVAGFATSIITAIVMDDDDDDEEGRPAPVWGVVATPNFQGLNVSGTF